MFFSLFHLGFYLFDIALFNVMDNTQTLGFIPDIHRLVQKYFLHQYMDIYLQTGTFPSRYMWKAILKRHVLNREKREYSERLYEQPMIGHICRSLIVVGCPSKLWMIARDIPCLTATCKLLNRIVGILYSKTFLHVCQKCDKMIDNRVIHTMCFCHKLSRLRARLWELFLRSSGLPAYLRLVTSEPLEQCCILIQHAVESI